MATSKCPSCENTTFEIVAGVFNPPSYKLNFVQCASCGTVVGVTDFTNVSAVLDAQNRAIKQIAEKLDADVGLL
jgi:uncharacterized Zn finger protein